MSALDPGPVAVLSFGAAVLALGAAALLGAARRARAPRRRGLLLGLGSTAGTLALLLAIAALRGDRRDLRYFAADGTGTRIRPYRHDPGFGAVLAPGLRVRAVKGDPARPLYDAVYTIDGFGNRVAPTRPDRPAVLFLGCSFTFGDGIADGDTLPWQFAQAIGRRLDVVNAGHSGQGAHQVLRLVETDRLAGRLPRGVVRAFYSAITTHPMRAAGLAPWDLEGPRYEPAGDGLRYAGPFHSRAGAWLIEGGQYLLGSRWLPPWEDRKPRAEDEVLWARIVARASAAVRERWGAPLVVVLWDQDPPPGKAGPAAEPPPAERMAALLAARGVEVVRTSELLPSGKGPPDLIPGDWHPTPRTNRQLARALARRYFPRAAARVADHAGPTTAAAPGPAPGARR